MKFYSEVLNKVFETPEECDKAEQEHQAKLEAAALEKKQKEEKANQLKAEVQKAFEALEAAQKNFDAVKDAYFKETHASYITLENSSKNGIKKFIISKFSSLWDDWL